MVLMEYWLHSKGSNTYTPKKNSNKYLKQVLESNDVSPILIGYLNHMIKNVLSEFSAYLVKIVAFMSLTANDFYLLN